MSSRPHVQHVRGNSVKTLRSILSDEFFEALLVKCETYVGFLLWCQSDEMKIILINNKINQDRTHKRRITVTA